MTPEDEGLQDSTPIIETMEARVPEPSIHPDGGTLRFLSELIEEFARRWGNKWMFHYRWAREADQRSAAGRIAAGYLTDSSGEEHEKMAQDIRDRMTGRGWVVGSNEKTAPLLVDSFKDGHSSARTAPGESELSVRWTAVAGGFRLGGRRSTRPGRIRQRVRSFHQGMTRSAAGSTGCSSPKAEGEFETWSALQPTLAPFLEQHVRPFLIWSAANAAALASGAEEFTVDLDGRSWTQTVGGPQKYHAKVAARDPPQVRRTEFEPGVAQNPRDGRMPRNAGLSPGVELVVHARVHSEGPNLFLFRLADRLAQIGAAIYCGFPLLVCYVCGKVANDRLGQLFV